MWYIIPHTKTKIIAHVHQAHGTRAHADGFFLWDVSIRNSLRSNKTGTNTIRVLPGRGGTTYCVLCLVCMVQTGWGAITATEMRMTMLTLSFSGMSSSIMPANPVKQSGLFTMRFFLTLRCGSVHLFTESHRTVRFCF